MSNSSKECVLISFRALQAGVTLCDKGKEEDDKNRYANALALYKKGLDYLAYAMKGN